MGKWTIAGRKLLNIVSKDCIYDKDRIEKLFRDIIGEETLMLGTADVGHTPKVGVTTMRSLVSSEIITSYNKVKKVGIPWTQRDRKCPDLAAWEA